MTNIKKILITTMITTYFAANLLSGIEAKEIIAEEKEVIELGEIMSNQPQKEVHTLYFEQPTRIEVTEREYELLCRVCMSECGGEYGEPMAGKIAVVETVLNRADMWDLSIEQVLYQPNQYSLADNGEPDETVRQAVDKALAERTYPTNMIYFRTKHFHSFGTPYGQIGSHFFSLEDE